MKNIYTVYVRGHRIRKISSLSLIPKCTHKTCRINSVMDFYQGKRTCGYVAGFIIAFAQSNLSGPLTSLHEGRPVSSNTSYSHASFTMHLRHQWKIKGRCGPILMILNVVKFTGYCSWKSTFLQNSNVHIVLKALQHLQTESWEAHVISLGWFLHLKSLSMATLLLKSNSLITTWCGLWCWSYPLS